MVDELLVARIIRDYTATKPCVVDDAPDAHSAWLVVGAQSFCITEPACESKEDAEMMCKMLAIAIRNILGELNE